MPAPGPPRRSPADPAQDPPDHSSAAGKSIDLRHQQDPSALLAAIVESSDDAIISKDTEGIITSWNQAAERVFGYTAQEAIGKHINILSMPGREWEMSRILGRILSNHRVTHYETVRRHKDGHPVLISLTVSPICNQDGVIIGASKIARDITARKQSEHALQQTEKLAMLGRLSASIAHEINNPLEAVTNLLFLLRNYPLPPDGYEYLQMAETELARISNIVTQTLAFHKQNSRPSPADITIILDSALAFLRHRILNRNITVTRRYRPAPPIHCLDGEIRQVALNLIANSLDAIQNQQTQQGEDSPDSTETGARLIVACRPATDWYTSTPGIRITFADDGPGIPPNTLPRIYEAFFTTKGNSGNGLGLWITSEIIHRHNGRIRVRSSQSPARHGTVFSIFLPCQASESASLPSTGSFQQSL
jgi:PAS domain S-box-containing protein